MTIGCSPPGERQRPWKKEVNVVCFDQSYKEDKNIEADVGEELAAHDYQSGHRGMNTIRATVAANVATQG